MRVSATRFLRKELPPRPPGSGGVDGEGGLRKWTIEGHAPEGLMDWEQFETLSQIPHRITLFTEENA